MTESYGIRLVQPSKQRCGTRSELHNTGMASRPSVAIVGGGIGGLFAANALLARGLRVAVYEQTTAIGEIGAGVYVTPNAVRHLETVGSAPRSSAGVPVSARDPRISATTALRSRLFR